VSGLLVGQRERGMEEQEEEEEEEQEELTLLMELLVFSFHS